MRQDQKLVWVYTGILHIGLEKCTSLYFWKWRFCFSSQEAFFCSFTSTVTCIWVFKILLKLAWQKVSSFHMSEEKENMQFALSLCYISLAFSTYSSSILVLLPILPFGLVMCTLCFFSDNLSRNNCRLFPMPSCDNIMRSAGTDVYISNFKWSW